MTNIKNSIRKRLPWLVVDKDYLSKLKAEIALKEQLIAELKQRIETANSRPVRSPALASVKNAELTDRLLSHPISGPLPKIEFGCQIAKPQSKRLENASRLLSAFDLTMKDPEQSTYMPPESEGNMWDGITTTGLNELIGAVKSGQAKILAEYLEDFGKSFVWFGGVTTSVDGYNRDLDETHVAITYWDSLVRVAEYLGVLPVESPESGAWGEALYRPVEDVVDSIEKHLKVSISAPLEIIHTDGLKVGDRLFHYRHINSLYSAIRLSEISRLLPHVSKTVEIGGGIGLVALYASRLGIRDYTLFDIPVTNILSGNYLLNALGPDSVCLYGEEPKDRSVKILPFWKCREFDNSEFSICLNQDSINELDDQKREFYRDEIARLVSGFFLSINHECFFPKTANALFRGDERFQFVSRGPYWPRAGYVEELYRLPTP